MSKVARHKIEKSRKDTIKSEISQKDRAFVLFYATWCPFSQRFLPVFEEFAESNSKECLSIVVDDQPEVCEEYSIEYYPTVILFRKGRMHKRLDAKPGIGLDRKQLKELAEQA